MKLTTIIKTLLIFFFFSSVTSYTNAQSTRQERRLITSGNKLYVERKFKDAAIKYQDALKENGSSAVAKYNLGMAQIRQVADLKDTTARATSLIETGIKNLSEVAAMAKEKPGLASKANYNLGNIEFNREKYAEAINFYKQALRIDPKDENARKNLRIAQLKQQNQNNDNKDNQDNQDNKQDQQQDQNKDQQQDQDKNKDQNQDQNKDQNQDQKKDNQQQNINNQTASQILQAVDNKENQTRARVNRANKGEKAAAAGARSKRW